MKAGRSSHASKIRESLPRETNGGGREMQALRKLRELLVPKQR